jgi:hypothetical protein
MISACFKVDFDVKHEQSIYEEPNHAGKVFLSKKPHDILWAEPVLRRLNDLFIIYMLRDPRDVVVSKHNYDPERYWVGLNLWKCYTPLADRLDANPPWSRATYWTEYRFYVRLLHLALFMNSQRLQMML